jgi:uncharacterized membrane protein
MATEAQLAKLSELGPQIIDTPIDALVTDSRWGTINFEMARGDLEVIFDMVRELQRLPVRIVPEGGFEPIINALTVCRDSVKGIQTFTIEQSNPSGVRDSTIANVKGAATQLLNAAAPWLPFLAYRQGDVQRNIDSMTMAAKNIQGQYDQAVADVNERRKDLDGIVLAAREASAVAGVGVFTADFAKQADDLDTEATTWLKRTAWAAIVTIVVAVLSMFVHIGDKPSEIAQFLTSKILALVVLISATVWCGRIYKAIKHQAASNRHRSLALKTFQAFAQATEDQATRNAVLLESTRSIFAVGPSGYLDAVEGNDSGTKVFEVIKGMSGKSDT